MFDLSEEQKMIQEMVRDFAQNEVRPRAEQIDRTHEFPADLVKKMAELGLMGVEVPEQWGGAGMDPICYAIAVEEVSAACGSTGGILSAHKSLACAPLAKFGAEPAKEK